MATIAAPAERTATRSVGANRGFQAAFYVLLILFGLFFLLPLIWMVVTA